MFDTISLAEYEGQALRTGLVGRGILASGSPWLHEKEAAAQGLTLKYELFDFSDRNWPDDALGAVLAQALDAGFSGLNVTFPFKQAVIPLLDDLSDDARAIGAVNTVQMTDGRLIGHNTDVTGFAAGFAAGLPDAALDSVLQIGCGGAGSATAHALLSHIGVGRLLLADSDVARREALRHALAGLYGEARVAIASDPAIAAYEVSGIVNATPVGMEKFPGMPISANAIEARHWIADIVYFPLVTEFLAQAAAKGCRTLDGSSMVIHQAAGAFEIFLNQRADRQRMRLSFTDFVRQGKPTD